MRKVITKSLKGGARGDANMKMISSGEARRSPTARQVRTSSVGRLNSGGLNSRPNRKYWWSEVHRKTVARSNETDRGSCALLTKETGTSNLRLVPGSKYRLVASSAPPADRFSAVANSKYSSPFGFLPLMKKGTEIGNRSHLRRSSLPFVLLKSTSYAPPSKQLKRQLHFTPR